MSRTLKRVLVTGAAGLAYLVVALGLTLISAVTLFGLPQGDIRIIGLMFFGVGVGVGIVVLLLMSPMVLGRLGGLRGYLAGTGLVCSFLLVAMLLAAAELMFISVHDFKIMLTMLLFAALLAIGFSIYGAEPLTRRIRRVREGTSRLAGGELDTEVSEEGHDEISALASDFNRMARKLEEAAEHEREMEADRRELIASVSHDLRTPLASVQALVEAVSDGVVEDAEDEARYLYSARKELTHLNQLVDDLFELSRIDAGTLKLHLEEASLGDLASDALSGFRSRAEDKGVRLVGEVSDDVDLVLANPPKLQRVLHNLLSNALYHTPTDGTVALRAEPEDRMVRVEIVDTGEGIAAEDLPRVFEHSFRGETSRARSEQDGTGGAGLGLAIARGLIEAHGGEVGVESVPGEGSRFVFTLQRAQ